MRENPRVIHKSKQTNRSEIIRRRTWTSIRDHILIIDLYDGSMEVFRRNGSLL